jgi:signal transduction histidine kinase
MAITTRLRLTLAQIALLAGVAALPHLARRVIPGARRSGGRARPGGRTIAGDAGALLVGAPAAYVLAGYALRPAWEARAQQERVAVAAAHELRTPMTVLLGTLEAALLRRRTPEQYEDVLRRATEEAVHLSDLLDEVLTLGHVESGLDTPLSVPLDLRAVARAAVADARPHAEGKGQTLDATLDGPLPVRGNGPTLQRALDSLLDNAVAHTPAGGAIRLTARRARGTAALTIRDTGPGIAPEHLPHLFEPFYRVDPARVSDGDVRHAGLGLSRAARIARAHDGRLTVESRVGAGSAFTLSLPLDRGRGAIATGTGEGAVPIDEAVSG